MKKLMIGVLSIGLSYGMKSDLTGDNQQLTHLQETQKDSKHNGNKQDAVDCSLKLYCEDGSDSPGYFAREERGFLLHGFVPEENYVPLRCFEDGENNFPFLTPDYWDLNLSDMMYGEARPSQKSRQEQQEEESLPNNAEEPQEQPEESFSSKRKRRFTAINFDKAEQEVREAIKNSTPYDLKSIAKKYNVLTKSLRSRLDKKGLIKERKRRLPHTENQQRISLALSEIKALRDAKQPFVWSRIAKKFRVNVSSLLYFRARIKTSFDEAMEEVKRLNSFGEEYNLRDIANHFKVKISYLCQGVRKLGLKTPCDLAVEKIRDLIEDNQDFKQSDIAKSFNIGDGTLSYALKKKGIDCKKRKICELNT